MSKPPIIQSPNLDSLSALQDTLIKKLNDARGILLVRDDVGYDKKDIEEKWEHLLIPFASRGRCKIILTSRSVNLHCVLEPKELIVLEDLKHDAFPKLFRHFALLDEEIGDPQFSAIA